MYEGKKRILSEGEISFSHAGFMEVDLWEESFLIGPSFLIFCL